MSKRHSKRYQEIQKKLSLKPYPLAEAFQFLKDNNTEKSSNIKSTFTFYWDEKKVPFRSNLLLPNPVKKSGKIAIIGEELPSALQNKTEIELVNPDEIVRRISKGKKSSWGFEKLLAPVAWQEKIKPLAKVLGPKKIFPNSKDGTLTDNLEKAVDEIQRGKVELRSDKDGNLHTLLGKTEFTLEQLEKNYQTLFKIIMSLKPTNWKGLYLQKVTFSTSMGPGIEVLT